MDDLFFTKEHDWIRFSETFAVTGIAAFKLIGIHKIDDIRLFDFKAGDRIDQGAVLLQLHYRDYVLPVYAPIDCILLEVNKIIANGSWNVITDCPEESGWLFKIIPNCKSWDHLLHPSFYRERFPFQCTKSNI